MTKSWELVGTGVALAWITLPLLTRVARSRASREPTSLHRRLVLVLLLSTAMLAVPALGGWLLGTRFPQIPLRIALQVLSSRADDASAIPGLAKLREFGGSPFAMVGAAWTVACTFWALRMLLLGWRLRRIVARAYPAAAELVERHRHLSGIAGVDPPALLVSDEAAAPFTVGLRVPVVVIPASLIETLDDAQQDLVLRHEIEHVRRGDLRSSALVDTCAVLFAGSRAARFLVQEIRLAREAAVDAAVAQLDPHAYAALLVEVASLARSGEPLASVSMDDTALARRIAMLTGRSSREPKLGPRAVIVAAVAAAILGLAAPEAFVAASSKMFAVERREAHAAPVAPHAEEIQACFDEARKVLPNLVIDTFVRIELRVDGTVLFATVPSPEAPGFQRCVEEKAMSWTFPPPPDAPFAPPPPGATMQVGFRIQLPAK